MRKGIDIIKPALMGDDRGVALVAVMAFVVMLTIIGTAAVITSKTEVDVSGSDRRGVVAFYLAEAGIERTVNSYLWSAFFDERLSPMHDPFSWLERQEGEVIFEREPLGDEGYYTVSVAVVSDPGSVPPFLQARDVTIESVGELAVNGERRVISRTVRFGLQPSGIFDYAYFMNHFGWWAGFSQDRATINGNTRANSHYELLSGHLTVNGNPRFNAFDGSVLDDGGVYATGFVLPEDGAGFHGMASQAANRHSFAGADGSSLSDPAFISMPNLNDPGDADADGNVQELNPYYEKLARGELGTEIGRVGIDENGDGELASAEILFAGVYGDEPGETGNIVLIGESGRPILIEGPVVVTDNVIIKGTVGGRGTIYAGRNAYVVDDLVYNSPPTALSPFADGDESAGQFRDRVEAWREDNAERDLFAIAARENIVVGDYTNWQFNYAMDWLEDYRNNGKEDVGKDGVFGRLDDPLNPYGYSEKEGDGQWTVQCREEESGRVEWKDLGLDGSPPAGWVVIAGTGEDLDGDGKYDDPYEYDDLALDVALNGDTFENLPAGVNSFAELSATRVTHIDACLYTNHALAGLYTNDAVINGAQIARNEAQVVGQRITITHDERLTGGGQDFGLHLPRARGKLELGWIEVSHR